MDWGSSSSVRHVIPAVRKGWGIRNLIKTRGTGTIAQMHPNRISHLAAAHAMFGRAQNVFSLNQVGVSTCGHLKVKCLLVLVALLTSAPMQLLGAVGSGLSLKGTYEYWNYRNSATPQFVERYNFNVLINDCSWIIDYEDTSSYTNADVLVVRTFASCDGTNIYVLDFQSQTAVAKAWGNRYDSVKEQLPVAIARIYQGAYPPPTEPVLQYIWVAFGSRCVLAHPTGKAKPPFIVDLAVFNSTNYSCNYRWELNDTEPNSRRLVFTHDGTVVVRDYTKGGKLLQGRYPPPYDKGYINGVGRWLQTTNIGGVSVPTDFDFTAFSIRNGGTNAADLRKAFTFTCKTTDAASNAAMLQIPTALPRGRVSIKDYRFAERGHASVTYQITDSKWRTVGDSYFLPILASAPKISLEAEALAELGIKPIGSTSKAKPPRPSLQVTRIAILLFMLSTLTIVLFSARKLRKSHK